MPSSSNGFHVGFSAVTGDLTVAAGYANGDKVRTTPLKLQFDDNYCNKSWC